MSDDNLSVSRRKRVNFIKGFLVTLFLAMIITPMIISITALTYVRRLDKKVDELTDQVSKLELTYMLKAQADEALDTMIADRSDQVIENEDLLAEQAAEPVKEASNEDANKKKVYLTFDDGPSSNTQRILDILDEYDVKATFFVTGYQAGKHPEWYKEIVDRGHTIGLHSYSHVYSQIYSSSESFLSDIDKLSEYIKETTQTEVKFLRFPGGSSNRVSSVPMSDLCVLMHERGIEYFDWNISSQDATSPAPNAAMITANVLSGIDAHETAIILMHDAAEKNATVEALPGIIEGIQARGDCIILPIDEDTLPVQHLSPVFEEE